MLTPPDGLSHATLLGSLVHGWGVTAACADYRPVGFGSHHWEIVDTSGVRWFATADDLETKRHSQRDSLDAAFDRLGAALAAASDLQARGHTFVVAPQPTHHGEPLARANERFAVALYPFITGQSFTWGEFPTTEHREAVLDLIITLHTAPRPAALTDDFQIQQRDQLESVLDPSSHDAEHGPYSRPLAALMARHAQPLRALLDRYDELAAHSHAEPDRLVLTHGEPHPGNTMLATTGWVLIDWDTALLAPPERDLWSLDPGDGSVLHAYAAATGVVPLPQLLELYRIRWDLADLAVDVGRFRRHHTGNADDDASWNILRRLVEHLSARPDHTAGPATTIPDQE